MTKLPREVKVFLEEKKRDGLLEAHIVKAYMCGYLEAASSERSGHHRSLDDTAVLLKGFEKAKEYFKGSLTQ